MRAFGYLSKLHAHQIQKRIPFFRIFYSGTFFVASLLLAALLLVTPGDHIQQAFKRRQVYHIVIVAAVYLLTFLVALLIYAGRMFKTRSALAAIPNEFHLNKDATGREEITGVDQGGGPGHGAGGRKAMTLGVKVNRQVGNVVNNGLRRSAIVAYESRPRDLVKSPPIHREIMPVMKKRKLHKVRGSARSAPNVTEIPLSSAGNTTTTIEAEPVTMEPVWGVVEHPGWSAPGSKALPNLHYDSVILELPNILEAKAASLAPPDPLHEQDAQYSATKDPAASSEPPADAPPLDPLVIDLLRRTVSMTLRDYIAHLSSLDMISTEETAANFVSLYERARFSGHPLTGREFRDLMDMFTHILTTLEPPGQAVIERLHDAADEVDEDEGYGNDNGDKNGGGSQDMPDSSGASQRLDEDSSSIRTNQTTINHRPRSIIYTQTPDSSSRPATAASTRTPRTYRTRPSANNAPVATRARTNNGSVQRRRSNSSSTRSSAQTIQTASDTGSVIRLADSNN